MAANNRQPQQIGLLLSHILGDQPHPLAAPLTRWLAESPLFASFVTANRDKIRKKVRSRPDAEAAGDLRCELGYAFVLTRDRRCQLEYERYAALKQRGPDFSATFKGHMRFDVEVARMRGAPGEGGIGKLTGIICGKLSQLQPGLVGILGLASDAPLFAIEDVDRAMRLLRDSAARRDDAFFARQGLGDSREFHKYQQRLSAIALRCVGEDGELGPAAIWANPQARHQLPRDVARLLV